MTKVTWILESEVFPDTHAPLRTAITDSGHDLVDWRDHWWSDGIPTTIPNSPVVFHGSLGNAARIQNQLAWSPGSFCPVESFHCSSWYEAARPWLVHADWLICPAIDLVTDTASIATKLQSDGRLFVRPDSPLKPFSGRVVDTNSLTLAKLDHGFYYDDETLPVVVAPVLQIGDEWRFVVVNQQVITGSAYDPSTRKPKPVGLESAAAVFASQAASELKPPSTV
ncbi:ATP-grasp domain-containing protein, partial [Bremerella sp.]|uniref:ATP-grasp domain-containing protein n=1 Tax=Bremerella sp. TaxID=2795602 RepID=UPI003918CDFA